MHPMLAAPGDHVPTGSGWTHEVKWDGMRILAEVSGTTVRLTSRNGNDKTVSWPDVARLPVGVRDLLVDGEVIALDEAGRPSFRALQERMHVASRSAAARAAVKVPVTFMVFDVLRLDGEDLTGRTLAERRTVLERLDGVFASVGWQVPAPFEDGQMLLEATRHQGLEGIVSKRLDSRYEPGVRSRSWLKFAHRPRHSYVVAGWRPQEGTEHRLASLLVGEMTLEGLLYRGKVGSGIGPAASRKLTALLAGTERLDSPFADEVPPADALRCTWVEPRVVIDVESLGGRTEKLRQPSYQGVRADVTPEMLLEED